MNKELISTIFKPFAAAIGWIGGTLAGITAIFSAIGYLVIRSHHDLLGIAEIVPFSVESLPVEGARFIYNSLFYLLGGLLGSGWVILVILLSILLPCLVLHPTWFAKLQKKTINSKVKVLLLGISFVGLIGIIEVFLKYQEPSHLLVNVQTYDTAIKMRSHETGIQFLRTRYALLTAMVILGLVWLKLLPHILGVYPKQIITKLITNEPIEEPQVKHWYPFILVLWAFFLIPLIFLPINYGKMVRSNDFFKVRLLKTVEVPSQPSQTKATQQALLHPYCRSFRGSLFRKIAIFTAFEVWNALKIQVKNSATKPTQQPFQYEGWLLYEDSQKLVLYLGTLENEPILIFKGDEFAQVQVLTYDNIFSGQ
jgi:hypothetical protein